MKGLIGSRILLKPEKATAITATGLDLEEDMMEPPPYGEVIQIGEDVLKAQMDEGCLVRIAVGDRLLFEKDRAWQVERDGVMYAIVKREHCHAVV